MKSYILTFQLILLLPILTSITAQNVEIQADTTYLDGVSTINRSYSLPIDSGSDGQVITSDGNGQSAWQSLPAPDPEPSGTYVYQIPYVCGFQGETGLPQGATATRSEGQYMTSIMLNNSALDTATVERQVVLLDAGEFAGPASGVVQAPADTIAMDVLPRFHSLELTCAEIDGMLGGGLAIVLPPIDGYIILESDERINVAAIYTYFGISLEEEFIGNAGGLGVGQGQSIDTEQIEPVFVPAATED